MRYILIFLSCLFTLLPASAQISGGGSNYNPANVAITGGTIQGISALGVSNAAPVFTLTNSSAAADSRNWDMFVSGTNLQFRVKNDASSTTFSWLNVIRGAGQTVASLQIVPDTSVAGLLTPNGGARFITTRTVSTLPTCDANSKGTIFSVSDAAAPVYNTTLTGGGAVAVLAFCNGTNWTAH